MYATIHYYEANSRMQIHTYKFVGEFSRDQHLWGSEGNIAEMQEKLNYNAVAMKTSATLTRCSAVSMALESLGKDARSFYSLIVSVIG